MTPQQIQQQHFFHYQQQQQQLYQQQQEQQLHLAQMQQHQLQLQHQMQQQQLQQFTNRQRAVSMQTPHSGLSQTPRPLSMNNSIRQNSSHDFRQARLSDETDMDMAITPELFDRIALSNISMPIPVAHAHHTTVTVNAVQAQEYSNAPTSAVPSRSNQTSPHHNSQNGGNIVFGNFYQNSSSSPNNTGPANAAGSSAVSPNNNNININQSTGYGLNSNSGSFIDFDESIFEDWVSDDTEMDFIDTTVPSKPTVCDFLLSGCASSQGFCSGSNTNGTGQYYSHQSSTYAQNTNGMCCGFPTAFSGDHTDQQSRQPAVGQQMVHGQSQVPQQITLNKSKPSGFGSSIRALGNRICGPGQVDSSYQHLDTAYDSKVYPGSQAMIKQEGGRTPTVMGPGLTSSYGQTALREQYAASRSKLDNRNGVSTGGAYPTQGFVQDGHVRSGYNSYFVGPAIVQMNTTINLNTAPPSPYTNPGYVYVNDSSDKTPAAESVMQSYTDTERSQSLGHC